jgi:hypothetical protein
MPYLIDSDVLIAQRESQPGALVLLEQLAPQGLAISIVTYKVPSRFWGTRSSSVLTRVVSVRGLEPWRWPLRPGGRSSRSAPTWAVISASRMARTAPCTNPRKNAGSSRNATCAAAANPLLSRSAIVSLLDRGS